MWEVWNGAWEVQGIPVCGVDVNLGKTGQTLACFGSQVKHSMNSANSETSEAEILNFFFSSQILDIKI